MAKLSKAKYQQERKELLRKRAAANVAYDVAMAQGDTVAAALEQKRLRMFDAQLDVLETEQELEGNWPKRYAIYVHDEWDETACALAEYLGYSERTDEYRNIACAAYEVELIFSVDTEGKVHLVGAWAGDDGVGEKLTDEDKKLRAELRQ